MSLRWSLPARDPHGVFATECCFGIVDTLGPSRLIDVCPNRLCNQAHLVACYGIRLRKLGVVLGLNPGEEACTTRAQHSEKVEIYAPGHS